MTDTGAVSLVETWSLRYPTVRNNTDGPTLTHTVQGFQGHPYAAVPWAVPLQHPQSPGADMSAILARERQRNREVGDEVQAAIVAASSYRPDPQYPLSVAAPVQNRNGISGVYGFGFGLLCALVFMLLHRILTSWLSPRRAVASPQTLRRGPAASGPLRPAA